jgi:hypothetical protein
MASTSAEIKEIQKTWQNENEQRSSAVMTTARVERSSLEN